MRDDYVKMLHALNDKLVFMGNMIENAIINSVQALVKQDLSYCDLVLELEEKINQEEKEIQTLCFNLLLRQQPVAYDLRVVSSALGMVKDMKRIGDNASDIANIAIKLAKKPNIKDFDLIPQMADEAIKMVKLSLSAFVNNDLQTVEQIEQYDDVVDGFFEEIKSEISYIILQNPASIDVAIELLLVAKYFEKISDHAVNIANWVKYSLKG